MTNPNAVPINVDQALPGMILSEAILDDNRGVLLPEGTALTAAAIASLRRRGIVKFSVAAAEISSDARQVERDRQQARLNQLFRRGGDLKFHDAARTLFNCLTRYRLD